MLTFKNAVITASQLLTDRFVGIHLSAKDGILEVSAQGSDEMILIKCDVRGAEFEHLVVDGKKIANFVKALGDEDFSLSRDGNSFIVETQKGKYDFGIFDAEPVQFSNVSKTKVEGLNLKQIIDCSFCASNDEFRLSMMGICLKNDKVMATDSFRGYMANSGVSGIDGEVLIPKHRINRLKLFNNPNVWIENDLIKLQEDGIIYICSLIDGMFPPLESIIPTSCEAKIEIPKSELISVLKRVLIFDNKTSFRFSEDVVSISATNPEDRTSCNEELPCKFTERSSYFETTYGYDLTMGFDVSLLIEILLHVNSENVIFVYKNESSPVLLDNYLIMQTKV